MGSSNEAANIRYGCDNSGRVPTLKYLVSQSLEGCLFDLEENRENVEGKRETIAELPEGSGDIASSVTKYPELDSQNETDVVTLLSKAYEKGTEWLQAGADLACNMFGDELTSQKCNTARKTSTQKTLNSLFASNLKMKRSSEEIGEVVQEAVASKTVGNIRVESNDTVYYNGYGICVKGKGLLLDSMFFNGNGPSSKYLEIRIRLQQSLNDTDPYGKLIRDHEGTKNDEQALIFRYSHGSVSGCVTIICPPDVDALELTSLVTKDGFIVITVL